MATTKSLGRKDKNDKFYTKPEIAKKLIDELGEINYTTIIEPSAGNGSFSQFLPGCIALDIEPEAENIIQQDFLTYYPPKDRGPILVIGNPPFGEQSKLALEFFKHAAEFANTIAFIVPRSFRKVSIQNKLPLNFWQIREIEIPSSSFLLNGVEHSVPCMFQVWDKASTLREKIVFPTQSKYFSFTKNIEEADFRVQRVGGNAGKAFLDKNGATSSNYYLINTSKFSNENMVRILNAVKYETVEDTIGPKSLPKGEFIYYSSKQIEKILTNNFFKL